MRLTSRELNILVYNPNQKERYGIWKALKRKSVQNERSSRSTPTPAAPDKLQLLTDEAVKAIKAQARDDAEEKLDVIRKHAQEQYREAELSDDLDLMAMHLDYENRIWDIMKSLRNTPNPQEQHP